MKKNLFLIFICMAFIMSVTHAKNLYYWSGGKKHTLTVDSTKIIGEFSVDKSFKDIDNTLRTKFKDIQDVRPYAGYKFVEIVSEKPLHINEFVKAKIFNKKHIQYSYNLSGAPFQLTGEILLMPKSNVKIEKILYALKNDLYIIERTKYNTYKLGVNDWSKILDLANTIYESGSVEYCHPNYIAEIVKCQVDPLYADQYYLNNTGQFGGTAGIDINAPEAWNISLGISRVRVAVIDDGVENHEDLNGRVVAGFSPTDPAGTGAQTNPLPPVALTIIGHGQACAGIIAATHNNLGVRGVAPCADIVPVNIFDDWFIFTYSDGTREVRYREDAFDLRDAIDHAWDELQADVLSNSWGYFTTNEAGVPDGDEITAAIGRARTQGRNGLGSVVVFSSGNYNEYFSGVTFPASVNGVVTVGAINNRGTIWNYSSRGAQMDLVAPSGDVRTTDRMGANGYEAGNYTNTFGGTSAACPQVSGVAALMIAINRNLTEAQVVNYLQTSATDMGSTGFDNTFGYGRLNAQGAINKVLGAMAISGPSNVCTSNSTFSVSNLPANSSISWTKSTNLTYVSGQGTNSYVVKADKNGSGWVRATLTGNGCDDLVITKTISVGLRASFSGPSSVLYLKTGTWTASATCGYTPYRFDWYMRKEGAGAAYQIASGSSLTLKSVKATKSDPDKQPANTTIFYLYVRAFDAHSALYETAEKKITAYGDVDLVPTTGPELPELEKMTEEDDDPGSNAFELYPNPASDILTIEISEETEANNDSYEIMLLDRFMRQLKYIKSSDKMNVLDISALKPDLYFVLVRSKDKQWIKTIMIE